MPIFERLKNDNREIWTRYVEHPFVQKIDKGYHLSQMFLEDVNSEFSESIRTLRTLMVAKFQKQKSPEFR